MVVLHYSQQLLWWDVNPLAQSPVTQSNLGFWLFGAIVMFTFQMFGKDWALILTIFFYIMAHAYLL